MNKFQMYLNALKLLNVVIMAYLKRKHLKQLRCRLTHSFSFLMNFILPRIKEKSHID